MGYSLTFLTAILFCLVSIIVRNLGELIIVRHPPTNDETKRDLTCLSEDDNAALVWNYYLETDVENGLTDFEPKKPPSDVSDCAIWNSTQCSVKWSSIDQWEMVNSADRPMSPVFDYRWEGFKEFVFNEDETDEGYQYVRKIEKSAETIVFSVRGSRGVDVLLCMYEQRNNGPCISIILGKLLGQRSEIRSCPFGNGGKCTVVDSIWHGTENIFETSEWRSLILKWNESESKIQVSRAIDRGDKPFLIGILKVKLKNLSHIFIKSDEAARVRFHFYDYYMAVNRLLPVYSQEFHIEQNFCIELLVGLCPECELRVNLQQINSVPNKIYLIGMIDGTETFGHNGLLRWRSVKLNRQLNIPATKVRLMIQNFVLYGFSGKWAIGNVRMCEPIDTIRQSTITTKRENGFPPRWPTIKCQKLSYEKIDRVNSRSNTMINDKTRESSQLISNWLKSCDSSCKSLGKNFSICDPNGCTEDCDQGFNDIGYRNPEPTAESFIWLTVLPIIAICMIFIFIWHRKRKLGAMKSRQPNYVEPNSVSLRLADRNENSTHLNAQELQPSIPLRPSYLEIIPPSPTTTPMNDCPALDTAASSPQPEITEDRSSDHVYTLPNAPDFCCVSIVDFAEYAKNAATSRRLHSQFEMLHRMLSSSPCDYGRLPENLPKNRNGSVVAYDHSRVVLKKIPGDPHSDYINASYIKGYKKEKAYIAAQGPKPNTVNDFWRMVWQEKVKVICMLTNVIEGGETKCEKYWPDVGTGMKYGDFHVSNTNDQVYADYTFRKFELSYKRETQQVTHLHYTGWPNVGVPTYPQSLVNYLKKLERIPDGNGPVIVHCSTGDDRTGTIILCAICLCQAVAEKVIDVMAVIAQMRHNRANMVGTLQQYVLAHIIITESLTSWPTQIPCADVLSNRINKLRIQLPYDMKRLSDTTWQLQALQSSAAISPPTAKHLTDDGISELIQDRPEVIYDDVFEREGNQINAVSVDGVKAKKQYLACWLPSPLTLPDFWEFIVERDIKLIIILQCSDPRDPTCCDIMPDESIAVPLLKIEVENQTDRDKGEYFTTEKLRLTKTSEENARSQSLTVLTCKGWRCGTIQKPPTPTALISLWQASEKIPRQEGQTLVLCHDGVTGCGLYLAMSFLLERMAVERECDVISAVRAVRRSNPKFVLLAEQCEYLYDAAQVYAGYFQCYANFS